MFNCTALNCRSVVSNKFSICVKLLFVIPVVSASCTRSDFVCTATGAPAALRVAMVLAVPAAVAATGGAS